MHAVTPASLAMNTTTVMKNILGLFCLFITSSACELPWRSFNHKCFKLKEEGSFTFTEAIEYCNAEGAILAQILSDEEQKFIEEKMLLLDYDEQEYDIWIGGVRVGHEKGDSSFRWLNGDRFNYSRWFRSGQQGGGNEPNNSGGIENCVALIVKQPFTHAAWWDVDCDKKMSVLCEKPADESNLHAAHSISLNYEIKSLYEKLDHLRREKHAFENKKWILVAIVIALILMIAVMFILVDLSDFSVNQIPGLRTQAGRQSADPIVTRIETALE